MFLKINDYYFTFYLIITKSNHAGLGRPNFEVIISRCFPIGKSSLDPLFYIYKAPYVDQFSQYAMSFLPKFI